MTAMLCSVENCPGGGVLHVCAVTDPVGDSLLEGYTGVSACTPEHLALAVLQHTRTLGSEARNAKLAAGTT